jgi:hypothetical protein
MRCGSKQIGSGPIESAPGFRRVGYTPSVQWGEVGLNRIAVFLLESTFFSLFAPYVERFSLLRPQPDLD